MKKKVIIIGGFCETYELCINAGYQIVGVVDYSESVTLGYSVPYLGNDEQFVAEHIQLIKEASLLITPDKPLLREKIVARYKCFDPVFETIISPKANISVSSKIQQGSVVQANTFISALTSIGSFVRINVGATIMHHSCIDDFTTIAPSATILGYVKIGKGVYVGSNATILPHLQIADNAVIGAGAVVTKSIPFAQTVVGVPAKRR